MKFYKLGRLPQDTIDFFLSEVLKRKDDSMHYQWIQFDEFLHQKFLDIFTNTELEIQVSSDKSKHIQKAFYSDPGYGFRIHKDGIKCRSALNIALSCNDDDWVRWYDEDYINNISKLDFSSGSPKFGSSRNTDLYNYEDIPYTHELRNQIGDVYVLDVDSYHSFKCIGPHPRIILQTKFEGFPTLETIYDSLKKESFIDLIRH